MGIPVVIKPSGGLAVTVSGNGYGVPMTEATNGYGIAVTEDPNGAGLGVTGITFGPDVTAPTITSTNTVSNAEGTVLAHTLTANETVTWAKVGGADTARFEISGNTLRWLSNGVKDFETPNDADTNNTYVVQVQATDTALNASTVQTITVTVTDVAAATPPDAPVLDLLTDGTDNTPDFELTGDLLEGDTVRFQYSTSAVFSGASETTNTIDAGEDAANELNFSTGALANNTWYFRARIERPGAEGTATSGWSNTETVTISVVSGYAGPGDIAGVTWFEWHGLRAFSAATATVKPVCDIRRLSDNTTNTFYSLADGTLNMAAVNTFLTATTGKIEIIYDQVGTMHCSDVGYGVDFVASATPNARPSAVNPDGGSRLRFNAVGNLVSNIPVPHSGGAVVKNTGTATPSSRFYQAASAVGFPTGMSNTIAIEPYTVPIQSLAATDNAFHDVSMTVNGVNDLDICLDGVETHISSAMTPSTIPNTDTNPTILSFGCIGHFLEGGLCTAMNSTQRAALALNQKNYYGHR